MYIKKGDIILVHSHNIIGRIIQFGMNVERWIRLDFSPFWEKTYDRAAICVVDEVIAEAKKEGIVTDLLVYAYPKRLENEIVIFRPELNASELRAIYYSATKYNGVRSPLTNFLNSTIKIFTNVWFGDTRRRAQDNIYITEYVALVLNQSTNGRLFKKYWRTNPNDIYKWCILNTTKVS